MNIHLKCPKFQGKNILIIVISAGILILVFSLALGIKIRKVNQNSFFDASSNIAIIQGNSLLAISNPTDPANPVQTIKMVVTAYSSTIWQTDNDPYITASGKTVGEGIVANNMLPFGTEIRIPELYGDKVFVVEDRMHWRKGYYHLDIWFPEYIQAKDFGAKRAYIEVLES